MEDRLVALKLGYQFKQLLKLMLSHCNVLKTSQTALFINTNFKTQIVNCQNVEVARVDK